MISKDMQRQNVERRLVSVLIAGIDLQHTGENKTQGKKGATKSPIEFIEGIVTTAGGVVYRQEDDSVTCLFGFPLALEDAPERAVRAAIAMLSRFPETGEDKTGRGTGFTLRVGIHSGPVEVTDSGQGKDKEYKVGGDTIRLASQIKSVTPEGTIFVSEQVYKATEYMFEYREEEAGQLKGIDLPLKVYQPLEVRKITGAKRGIKGLYSPLVGREAELDLIKTRICELAEGKSGVLFVTGDAGIGKSRLWQETKNYVEDERPGVKLFEGQCQYHGEHLFYWPILQMLEGIYSISDKDTLESIRNKILLETKKVLPDAWQDVAPYIGNLFSLEFTGELGDKVKYLDPREIQIKTLGSIKRILEEISKQTPVVLAIEDYHWIDSPSLAFLEFMFCSADSPGISGLLLVCLSRDGMNEEFCELKHDLRRIWGNRFTDITLKPLDKYASLELTYNLLEIPGFSRDFKEKVLAKAEGNPFFLEEIISSFIESGVLSFEAGMWKQRKPVEEIEIPDSIQLVISARLDRLQVHLRDLLEQASVVGRTFRRKILEEIAEKKENLAASLKTLEEYEFIKELPSRGSQDEDTEYIFKHPLIQQVTYAGLAETHRRNLHTRVASTMESLYKDRIDDFVGLIAQQYASSDDFEKAVTWLLRAGKKASQNYANDDALAYNKTVITIIDEKGLDNPKALIASYESMGDIFKTVGKNADSINNYSKALEISEDLLTQARIIRKTGDTYQKQSSYDEALAHLNRSKEKLDELKKTLNPDEPNDKFYLELYTVYHHIAWVHYLRGDFEKAQAYLERCFEEIPHIRDKKERNLARASALNVRAAIKTRTGRLEETHECYVEAEELFKEEEDLAGLGTIYNNCVNYYSEKGDYISCIRYLEKSIEIATKIGNALGETISCYNLGHEYLDLGNYELAKEYIDRYQRINKIINNRLGEGWANEGYAQLYGELDMLSKALECIDTAIGIFKELKSEIKEMSAKLVKASLLVDAERYPEAEELLGQVEEYSERNSIQGFILSAHILRGEIHLKSDAGVALSEFRKAEEMATGLGWETSFSDIYYHIGEALKMLGDPEHVKYFEKAKAALMENAEKITDEGLRRSFLSKSQNKKILSA